MKLKFNSPQDYLDIQKQDDKIIIVLSAKDPKNNYSTIVNSVEITMNQFLEIIKEMGIDCSSQE